MIRSGCRRSVALLLNLSLLLPWSASVLGPLPAVALESPGSTEAPGRPVVPPSGDGAAPVPEEVRQWAKAAGLAHGQGKAAEAVQWQQKVADWVRGNLPAGSPLRAQALLSFGVYLSAAGRSQEALAPVAEAVEIHAQRWKSDPQAGAQLATSLTELGKLFSEVGNLKDALTVTAEAVEIQRGLSAGGPEHRAGLATMLSNLGAFHRSLGNPREALPSTEESVRIRRELFSGNPELAMELAASLTNLAVVLGDIDRREDALAANREAVQIYRQFAAGNPAYRAELAAALINLGRALYFLGEHRQGVTALQESTAILKELTADSPVHRRRLAAAQTSLASLLLELSEREEALTISQQALQNYRLLSAENPDLRAEMAGNLITQAKIHMELGRRLEAQRSIQEVVQIYRQFAEANPAAHRAQLAHALTNQSAILGELGLWQEAIESATESVQIYRELAAANPLYRGELAMGLVNLGSMSSSLGNIREGISFSEEALVMLRDLAKGNPLYIGAQAKALNNLGVFMLALGDRQKGLAYGREALVKVRVLASANPAYRRDLLMSLINLVNQLEKLGQREEGLAAAEESVRVGREMVKESPGFKSDLAMALANLGVVNSKLGRQQQALLPAKEAVEIYVQLIKENPENLTVLSGGAQSLGNLLELLRSLGQSQQTLAEVQGDVVDLYRTLAAANPAFLGDLAQALNNQGVWFNDFKRPRDAIQASQEAVRLYQQLSKNNPAHREGLAMAATNLATLRIRQGDPDQARPLLREAVASEVTYLQGQLPLLPESRRQALVEVFGIRWQLPFSLAGQGDDAAALALFTRLNRQGLLQDIQRTQALLSRSGPQRPVFEKLTVVAGQLASGTLTPEQRQQYAARLEALEEELYGLLPQSRPQLVEPAQIARLLPADGALVEFQRFYGYETETDRFGASRYLALLLRPDGSIAAIPLGDAAAIDGAVARAVAASADPDQQEEALQRLAEVSRLVLAPLQSRLGGVRQLYLSPDGELNRLPFAALPVAEADGRTLAEAVSLRILTTGRDLLRLQQQPRQGGQAVLIAAPDFDARVGSSAGPGGTTAWQGLPPWQPLTGTAEEARLLAAVLRPAALISGREATASVALVQKGPRILHIATHGFFLEELQKPHPSAVRSETTQLSGNTAPPSPLNDPLQRSGLVFAGANHAGADPADDGYLTAAEATAMDLDGTDLVTLSACETGRGDVRSGEGVYGLQRSLAVAGARSTLLSLWKVDDTLTAAFMKEFYGRLRAGQSRADALRDTQASFRSHKDSTYNDVRVWGAFQLSGDWRPMPGL